MSTIEIQIATLIEEVAEAGSENRLDPKAVRKQILLYLEMQTEEIENFPELVGHPFCALLAADYDRRKRAMLILVLFDENEVVVATGHGDFSEIREFGENDYPEDESLVITEAQKRFHITSPRYFDRNAFESWLHTAE